MIEPTGSETSKGPPPSPPAATEPAARPLTAGDSKPLTTDEQMALYEQDLKENDWGHQPC